MAVRLRAAVRATQVLRAKMEVLDKPELPDQNFESVNISHTAAAIATRLEQFQPDVVYSHFIGDLNQDHVYASRATRIACRPKWGVVPTLLEYEVLSSTEWGTSPFEPTEFVTLEQSHWDSKFDALEMYHDEIPPTCHARSLISLQALAEHRGHSVGVARAEAFSLVRRVR